MNRSEVARRYHHASEDILRYAGFDESKIKRDEYGKFTKGESMTAEQGSEYKGPVKPLSKKVHEGLGVHGWQRTGEQSYTHPEVPGHVITLKPAEPAGGGRMRAVAESKDPEGNVNHVAGAEQIIYHGMRRVLHGRAKKSEETS